MPTLIEWVKNPDGTPGETINVFRAINKATGKRGHFCEKISPGCKNCYAARMQKPWFTQLDYVATNRDKVELFFDEKAPLSVLRRKKPTSYFWHDMTDMFWEGYPDEWIDRCFAVMALTPQHTHMVLTKRAERMRKYFAEVCGLEARRRVQDVLAPTGNRTSEEAAKLFDNWPLKNAWLGVSVENQGYANKRIPLLLQTPAALRFISAEPLLGPLDIEQWLNQECLNCETVGVTDICCNRPTIRPSLDWVIAGYESGKDARAGHPQWARQLRDQTIAAGKKFHFKQWGEYAPGRELKEGDDAIPPSIAVYPDGLYETPDCCSRTYEAIEPNLVEMRKVGKKHSGALLDGHEWRDIPEVHHA